MADKTTNVDPIELRMMAKRIDVSATDMHAAHTEAHQKMSGALAGFGSSTSAAALSERIASWEAETTAHHAALIEHSESHATAAMSYETTDDHNSTVIDKATEQLARDMGL